MSTKVLVVSACWATKKHGCIMGKPVIIEKDTKKHQNKQTGIWWYMYIGIYIYIYIYNHIYICIDIYWCFGLVVFIPKKLAVWKNPRCLNSLEASQIWLLRTWCSSSFHSHRLRVNDKPILSCWLSRSKFQFYPNKMVALIHRLCVFGVPK